MDREDAIKEDLEYLLNNVQKLNELWSIQDVKIHSHNIIKRLIRKLTYWLYKPMWEQQSDFNMYLTAAVSDLYRLQSREAELIEEGGLLKGTENILPESKQPRIIQLVSSLNYGDAVGNEVVAYKKALEEAGYITQIFAKTIHKKIPAGTAYPVRLMPELREEDMVIYHFSSQCGLFEYVKKIKAKIILRYHNITPPSFFHGYDEEAEKATRIGLEQVKELKKYVSYCLPVSEFNRQDLIQMGYSCKMQVIPILIRFQDYKQKPDPDVIERYQDGRKNLLFVGRMAPNKKVEDIISSFAYYKEHYQADARLFLIGSYQEEEKYYKMLQKQIEKHKVKDIIFSGHTSFASILAYYHIADVFICMSEHEGFCVPLVEAMFFHVPIIAYNSCAIPDTMGEELQTLKEKNVVDVAEEIDKILGDDKYRKNIIVRQNKRLDYFMGNKILEQLLAFVQNNNRGYENEKEMVTEEKGMETNRGF